MRQQHGVRALDPKFGSCRVSDAAPVPGTALGRRTQSHHPKHLAASYTAWGKGRLPCSSPAWPQLNKAMSTGGKERGQPPWAVGQACGGREQLAAVHSPREGAGCKELVGGGENRVSASEAD